MKKRSVDFILILSLGVVWFFARHEDNNDVTQSEPIPKRIKSASRMISNTNGVTRPEKLVPEKINSTNFEPSPRQLPALTKENNRGEISDQNQNIEFSGYEVVDGLAVVEGDIVLGVAQSGKTYQGPNASQSLQLWPGAVIPYIIQGDLPNPERVIQAMALITTGITFQTYNGQTDVLVFEAGSGNCRSYLGRVGGKQPLWIGPGCGAKEVAHEIMHALGFIHEQNRADRDSFIEIHPENIQETAKLNFERFPPELMKVSGLGAFDYESIMLYPGTMFSKDGTSETMNSRIDGRRIHPGAKPSLGDILRLEQLPSRR